MDEKSSGPEPEVHNPEPEKGPASPGEAPKAEKVEHEKNTVMAALAYIGPLVVISYLAAKDDAFVKFHIKQGLLLFVAEIATWMIGFALWPLWPLIQAVNVFIFVLTVVGIIRVAQGETKELPLIGHWAKHLNI